MWLKIKVWTKVIVFALLAIYALLFVLMNTSRKVVVWFWFGREPETSPLILAVMAFLIGVLGTILVRTTFNTLKQLREMNARSRSQRLEREVSDMRTKAAMLRTRPEASELPPSTTEGSSS